MQRAGGAAVEIRLPKYGSERSVPMPDELAAILREHEELGHLADWLFAGGEDNPPHQNTVGHQWRLTQKRAGLSGIRLHDLRHFYASGLIADGLRRGHRAAGAGARQGEHHAGHLRQALALRRGPDPAGRLDPRPAGARAIVRAEMRARRALSNSKTASDLR